MIHLQPLIEHIKALLAQDTDSTVTYAALEARLAIEKFVYDRLRQRHDYISHAQLKRWQPGEIVKTLLIEVDEHATETVVLQMSTKPHVEGVHPADEDFVTIGTEIGFDAKKIARMWQALSNLALHVRQPKHRTDDIPDYGEKEKVRSKVEQVLAELERLSAGGTMTFSGIPIGGHVSFICTCGEENRRRANLLSNEQHVFCVNPDCDETWKVELNEDGVTFENVHVDVACKLCGAVNHIPWRLVTKMGFDQMLKFPCPACNGTNLVKWQLMQAVEQGPPEAS